MPSVLFSDSLALLMSLQFLILAMKQTTGLMYPASTLSIWRLFLRVFGFVVESFSASVASIASSQLAKQCLKRMAQQVELKS